MQLSPKPLRPVATRSRSFTFLIILIGLLMLTVSVGCEVMVTSVAEAENRICYGETQVGWLYSTKEVAPLKPVVKVIEQKTGTNCNCGSDLLTCDGDQPYFGFEADKKFTCVPSTQATCSGLKDEDNAEKRRLCVNTEEIGEMVGDTIYPWGAAGATGGGCVCGQDQKLACRAQPFWLDVEDLNTISCIPMDKQCATLDPSVIMKVCNNEESVGDISKDAATGIMIVKPVGATQPGETTGQDCGCPDGQPPECKTPPKLKPRHSSPNQDFIPINNLKCAQVDQECDKTS